MLLWLNGTSNNKWRRQRELRARAAGAVLPRRRPRLQRARRAPARPRADRLPQRLDRRRARTRFRFDPQLHDGGVKRIYGRRGRFGWQDGVPARRRATAATRRSWSTKLWSLLRPDAAARRRRRARSSGSYVALGPRGAPAVEAILRHPHLYDREPADGQAAGRPGRGHAARGRPRRSTRPPGRGCATAPASCCSCRRTSRAGTTRAGWTPRPSARAGRWRPDLPARPARPGEGARRRPTRRSSSPRALAFWGDPPLSAPTRAAPRALRGRRRWAPPAQAWERDAYPVLTENALRMLVATSPDYLTS